ncbi:MAG: sigma-70 family RNA polymerase sigma factor [Pirellulaceae bacterium]
MECEVPTRSEVLFAGARDGDGDQLGELLQKYSGYLKLLAQVQLEKQLRGRVSPSDVVQETLMEAHRDFEQFRGTSQAEFAGWLRRILVHTLARLVEYHVLAAKRDVRREIALEDMSASLERSTIRLGAILAAPGTSPSSAVEHHEHLLALADALAALRPEHGEVIRLRHLEGLPFAQVAERLQRTEGAVRMLWLRAIEQLRRQLAKRDLL